MKLFRFFVILSVNISFVAGDNASKPKAYNIEQFLNTTDRELRAHKKQLDELQKREH